MDNLWIWLVVTGTWLSFLIEDYDKEYLLMMFDDFCLNLKGYDLKAVIKMINIYSGWGDVFYP